MNSAGIQTAIVATKNGMEMMGTEGISLAVKCNDALHKEISKYPGRFKAYAVLAVQDVAESVKELVRCRNMGFVGWLAASNFGESNLDDERYFPILEKLQELGMFLYLHPAIPYIDRLHGCGRQLFASGYGFGADVSITLLRMIYKGVFDRLPNLKVALGHLGEGLPFVMDRLPGELPAEKKLPAVNEHAPAYYFKKNIWFTTSGKMSVPAFNCTKEVVGIDKIMMGSDTPMDDMGKQMDFLKSIGLNQIELEKVLYKNAEEYFSL